MKCQQITNNRETLNIWHRFWCRECRAARATDALIARGIRQMRREPVRPEGLSETLLALGLREAGAASARPVVRRGPAAVTTRRVLMATALGVGGVFFATSFLGRSETAVLAETLAAMERVSSFHLVEVSMSLDEHEGRTETWYANGKYRFDSGREIMVDDGKESRTYRRGSRVVTVDLSSQERTVAIAKPGEFLRQTLNDKRSYNPQARVTEKIVTAPSGQRLQWFEIITPSKNTDPPHWPYTTSRFRLWVDPATHLPVRWEEQVQRKRDGQWQLNNRSEKIEFNVGVPDRVFQNPLPPEVHPAEFDLRKRAAGKLATQVTTRGDIITVRTLYLSEEGDVIVVFGAWGEAKAHLNPDLPGSITSFTDDRGTEYAPMREVLFSLYGSVETRMTPLTPRKSGDLWPRKFNFAFRLKDGEKVYFTGVPAPPPPYVSVREIPDYSFTNGKPAAYLEAKRREMRAEYRAQKGGERP